MTEYQDSHFSKELKESDLYILTEFFKVLGNPACIRILLLLMEQDSCVGDLAEPVGELPDSYRIDSGSIGSFALTRFDPI